MENKDLATALTDEIGDDYLQEIATDLGDVAIDQILTDEILKEIPIFGLLLKTYKSAIGIREQIFIKKIAIFLFNLKDVSKEKRQAFINKIDTEKEFGHKVGEKLLILLERVDDLQKPQIIAKIFKAAVNEHINYEQFLKLSAIVERAFLPDLLTLKTGKHQTKDVLDHFVSIGVMTLNIELKRNLYRVRASIGGKDTPPEPELKYIPNTLYYLLIQYGLK